LALQGEQLPVRLSAGQAAPKDDGGSAPSSFKQRISQLVSNSIFESL